MKAFAFWKAVCVDDANLLELLAQVLEEGGIAYCVVGGQAVNAYCDPVVSLDLDLVVAADDLGRVEERLHASNPEVRLTRFPHSLNVGMLESDLRVQFQMDSRYQSFIDRAARRAVLGVPMPVAAMEDVLRGKVWAVQDRERRPSKRQKDLADIARLLEARPDLRPLVPEEVLDRLLR